MNKRKSIYFFLTLYLALLCVVLFFRNTDGLGIGIEPIRERLANSANGVPFLTVKSYRQAVKLGTLSPTLYILNIYGNSLLFFPLGFMLPYVIFSKSRYLHTCCVSLIIIIVAEAIQLIFGVGRADIDDVILNFIGSLAGTLINRLFTHIKNKLA